MRRALAVLLITIAAACRREPPRPTETATVADAGQDGGRIVRRLESDPTSLNYVLHTTEDERQVLDLLYEPLIDFDQNLNPVPGTAAKWEVQDAGKTYILHLDPRATFSDKTPVLASDVVFTLHKILDEESVQFASWFEGLDREGTRAIDERTVRVAFNDARAAQLLAFNIAVMPEHVYAKGDFKRTTKVIGNGAYVIRRRVRGRSIQLERRDDYWRTKPRIRTVLFHPITDNATAWRALTRGDVDVTRVDNDTWSRVKDDPAITSKIEFFNAFRLGYNAIAWNLSDPMLEDARVRRALAMSFDRHTVIERLYHGQARAVTGPFTPDSWANNPEVTPIDYNPTAAKALLASAGWHDADGDGILDRNGKPFELTLLITSGTGPSRDQAQVFQQSLRQIGVVLNLRASEEAAFYDLILKRNYQAAYLSWVNEPDPDPFSLFHSSQLPPDGMNVVSYRNAEADQLMEEARTELDPARRADLYHQLHDVLARDQPYLWTVQVSEKWGVNRRVHNVAVAKGLGLFHWSPGPLGWWLEK
ncbi:MAG: ABC transporter substrate-binding protein [Acidobacteriota bacterium]|nr:ABC transporter substrate-binding protein [Acidobacteriota bacterium]